MADKETFPYFPLYHRDWLAGGGTSVMTAEEKGAFIDLLCYAWEQSPPCTLPDDDVALAKLGGVTPARWKRIGPTLRKRFDVVGGRLRNSKQWTIYLELCEHRGRRRRAGKKGNEVRWGSQCDNNATAMRSPPPSPSEFSIENSSVQKERKPSGGPSRVTNALSVVPGGLADAS